VAEMQNSSENFIDSPRVFRPEASYRRRGDVRSGARRPHPMPAWPGAGLREPGMWGPGAPLLLSFGSLEASGKDKTSGTCFVQF
jgi:hypothetical protein